MPPPGLATASADREDRRPTVAASAVVATAALWVLHGPAHLGYDPAWGGELAGGRLPRLGVSPAAPTPTCWPTLSEPSSPRSDPARRRSPVERGGPATRGASLVPLAIFLVTVPDQVRELCDDSLKSAVSRAAQRDLEQVLASPEARTALRRCGPGHVHDFRVRPLVWYWAGIPPGGDPDRPGREGRSRGVRTPEAGPQALAIAARTAFYKEVGPARRLLAAPPGAQVAAASNAWRLDLVGCR